MNTRLDLLVRVRAGHRCEYCKLPQSVRMLRFPIDHIISRQHGGRTLAANLALSCGRCNLHKGPNIAGIDPVTGDLTRLFHPRRDRWQDHFEFENATLTALTSEARATIMVLDINNPEFLETRMKLMLAGEFPLP